FATMEPSVYEDEVDDWFIESLHLYGDLHLFELQDPTRVIEWTGGKSICVAGYGASSTRNEILQLALPQKLFVKENQGLCPERDFKVEHGGFSDTPIDCLKHVSGTRTLVSSGPSDNTLHIWQIGDEDSDVIRRAGVIEPEVRVKAGSRVASGVSRTPCVLHASRIKDLQITELESRRVLYSVAADCADRVSGLEFLAADVFLVCADSGGLWLCDVRDPAGLRPTATPEGQGPRWRMGVKKGHSHVEAASGSVARLSSSCQVLVTDLRSPRSPLCQARLNIHHDSPNADFMAVTWAPALDDCLAVSGFDGAVRVYETKAWSPNAAEAEPLFVHKGHSLSHGPESGRGAAVVTTHVWHPWKPRTVLSAATNGSLHVWDWVDNQAS
uniref:WD repeat domain 73 n=1 Tax=Lepisosteus oculatus TaxID=7918 RepID=W5M2B4_LEPOC